MAIWHAIKGQQKDVFVTQCERCGEKIRIRLGEPRLCHKCLSKKE